ncbi:hypothetical protein [Spongiactinospora sp. 9N601]|uniref:hypothetical protein n=1 Tax=Spongiactinospora sp. 9N601 TaxID=3375149 RepID=UPI0037995FAB
MVAPAEASWPYPEAAWRHVVAAIDDSGYLASKIASCTKATVEDYLPLAPDLKGHDFDKSTICHWRRGGVKTPRREKMVVLKLTLLRLDDPSWRRWSDEQRMTALRDAIAFADEVWRLVVESRKSRTVIGVGKMSARHARTVHLLGEYGALLLQHVNDDDMAEVEAKLAVLHQLAGDGDDVRYWSALALVANPAYEAPSSHEKLLEQARCYAAEYKRAGEHSTARIYLSAAAKRGDGLAAFELGLMADFEGNAQEAVDHYQRAADLGCLDGQLRAERLKATVA